MDTSRKKGEGSSASRPEQTHSDHESDRSTKMVFYGFMVVLVIAVLLLLVVPLMR